MDGEKIVTQALGLLGRFERLPGFRARPQQRELVKALVHNLDEGGQVLLEAPTGTGKTLAYLCAALCLARARNRKLVIATGTVNLQRQLVEQELPRLEENAGAAFFHTLAKGRGRYACITRLEALAAAAEPGDLLQAQALFKEGEWNGDLDEWREPLSPHFQERAVSTRQSCPGQRCPHDAACAFQQMRRRVLLADVVVANHSLLLADLELGGGRVLPPPENCLVVVDEAHGLPRRVLAHAERRFNPRRVLELLRFSRELDGRLRGYHSAPRRFSSTATRTAFEQAVKIVEELQATLLRSRFVARRMKELEQGGESDLRLLPREKVTDFLDGQGAQLLPHLEYLAGLFDDHARWLAESGGNGGLPERLRYAWSLQVPAAQLELERARDCWRLFLKRTLPTSRRRPAG